MNITSSKKGSKMTKAPRLASLLHLLGVGRRVRLDASQGTGAPSSPQVKSPRSPQLSPNAADNHGVNGAPTDNSVCLRSVHGTGKCVSGSGPIAPNGSEPLHRLHRDEHSAPTNRGWLTATFSAAAAFLFLILSTGVQPAQALTNPERTYEQVSPIYKGGYGTEEIVAAAPNGESVAFYSFGGFAGLPNGSAFAANTYLARRGASGWSTGSLQPPSGEVADFSASMEEALASAPLGPNTGVENFAATEQEFLLHSTAVPDTPGSWEVDGGIVLKRLDGGNVEVPPLGASGNLCHVVLSSAEGPLLPGAAKADEPIYELARGCGSEPPSLRFVAMKNNTPATLLDPSCNPELGVGGGHGSEETGGVKRQSDFNAIADEGDEVFFTTGVEGSTCSRAGSFQVFVRLGGARTLEVSRPLDLSQPAGGCVGAGAVVGEVPCAGAASRASAFFMGASEDGSRVFFVTKAPLVSGDEDIGDDLYMATIGCPGGEGSGCEAAAREVTSLVQVSHDSTAGEAAEVQGVTALAPDGSRVYFVAHGVLSGEGPSGEGVQSRPVKGAENLYVYDSVSGRTAFVADLCSGPGRSGTAEDLRCPSDLSEGLGGRNDAALLDFGPAQTAGKDAGFLAFTTHAQLIAKGPEADTDDAQDVYRYDAETGALNRVSLGEAGADADGNQNDTAKVFGSNSVENGDALIGEPSVTSGDDRVVEQQERLPVRSAKTGRGSCSAVPRCSHRRRPMVF